MCPVCYLYTYKSRHRVESHNLALISYNENALYENINHGHNAQRYENVRILLHVLFEAENFSTYSSCLKASTYLHDARNCHRVERRKAAPKILSLGEYYTEYKSWRESGRSFHNATQWRGIKGHSATQREVIQQVTRPMQFLLATNRKDSGILKWKIFGKYDRDIIYLYLWHCKSICRMQNCRRYCKSMLRWFPKG